MLYEKNASIAESLLRLKIAARDQRVGGSLFQLVRLFLPEAKRSWCLSGELVVNVSGHWVVVVLAHLQVVVVDPRDGSLPGGVAVPSGHDV